MLTSVRSTLASHETDNTWTKIPALVTALEELDSVIAQIGEQLEATATPSGASASKATALDTAVGKLTAPLERLSGVILLGTGAIRNLNGSFSNNNNNNQGF